MPITRMATSAGFATPEELALLQRVFNDACRRNGYTPGDEASEALASDIIGRFMIGETDEKELLESVTETRADRCA